MVRLGIITSIGKRTVGTGDLQSGIEERHEAVNVDAWSSADEDRQE